MKTALYIYYLNLIQITITDVRIFAKIILELQNT